MKDNAEYFERQANKNHQTRSKNILEHEGKKRYKLNLRNRKVFKLTEKSNRTEHLSVHLVNIV